MNLSLKNIAEEYFSSLNPIAERISIDVAATKNAYEDLWHTLNLNDQCQVINETIIHPEVMLKYSFHLKDTPEVEYFTHKLDTQEKYLGDDEGGKGSANQHLESYVEGKNKSVGPPPEYMRQKICKTSNIQKEDEVLEKALEILNQNKTPDVDTQIFGNFVASEIRNLRSESYNVMLPFHDQSSLQICIYTRLGARHLGQVTETSWKSFLVQHYRLNDGFSWQDEHSSPFTWLTQSQLNLNIFKDSEISTKKSRGSLESQEPLVPTKKPPSVYSFVDPPNIVLGGSTTKLVSNTRLKFPPKSSNTEDNSEGLILRLKNKTAVLKIQSLKSVVGRSGIKKVNNTQENESLVTANNKCTVVPSLKLLKPVGVKSAISKPKNPPPPPPPVKSPLTEKPHHEFETKALLSTTSTKDYMSPMNINKILLEKEKHFEDFNPSTSGSVLKTGFDFLDNW
ncbi:unnamed protein product [Timema podura]|uniref:DUF4706 domain-containing protein n=1 Tax=Timema podura TaxID=61482 RepID=A0ABN7NV67_TIMPD|nr:unnamed protein product [Timema podura]